MFEETNSNATIKMEPVEHPHGEEEFDGYDDMQENDEVYLQRFIKSEIIIEEEMEQETFDDASNSDEETCLDMDTIYLQRFLKSEVTIDEDIKQDVIHNQDTFVNDTNSDKDYCIQKGVIYLQQFSEFEMKFNEKMLQESCDDRDDDTSINDTGTDSDDMQNNVIYLDQFLEFEIKMNEKIQQEATYDLDADEMSFDLEFNSISHVADDISECNQFLGRVL
ncbi:uncharacterized protein LOC113363675 [Ctenocephalides felis]|uniref:uncharacterized protein LOC113363675 n=1 Tax=Ctenocephalides felis TaxID=7515 RepID=UPI000E6E4A12|nr:uncharacterized protein LOC113363675 [Ctenocephalides felis]